MLLCHQEVHNCISSYWREICFSLQATSSATVGPAHKVADQRGKWKPRYCSAFKPVAIYTLESRRLEDNYVMFAHLMSALFARRRRFKGVGKDNGRIVPRATLTTEHRWHFSKTELFTREIGYHMVSHLDTKQPLVVHLLLQLRAPHVSPATLIIYRYSIHMLVVIFRYLYRLLRTCRVIYTSGKVKLHKCKVRNRPNHQKRGDPFPDAS